MTVGTFFQDNVDRKVTIICVKSKRCYLQIAPKLAEINMIINISWWYMEATSSWSTQSSYHVVLIHEVLYFEYMYIKHIDFLILALWWFPFLLSYKLIMFYLDVQDEAYSHAFTRTDMNQNFVNDMQMYSCRLPHKYVLSRLQNWSSIYFHYIVMYTTYFDVMTPVSFQKEGVTCYLSPFSILIQHHLQCKLYR